MVTSGPGPGNPYGEQYPNQQPGWQPSAPGGYGPYTPPPGPGPSGLSTGGVAPTPPGPWAYGQQQQQPPPQPPKNNTGMIIAITVGVVVVLAIVGTVVGVLASKSDTSANKPTTSASPSTSASASASSSPSASSSTPANPGTTGHTITLPVSAGGYTRTTGNVADRMTASLRDNFAKNPATAAIFQNAKIGLFTNGDKQVIFIGMSASDSPQLAAELQAHTSSFEVDSVFTGAGVGNANDYPAGPFGGTLRCGTGTSNGVPQAMCSWADPSTFAMIMQPNSTSADSLAPVALDFRNASEH